MHIESKVSFIKDPRSLAIQDKMIIMYFSQVLYGFPNVDAYLFKDL